MSLLNAFVDSFVCVGFSSKRGLTLDPESKSDASIFTSNLQPTVLAIITNDRAAYPQSRGEESFDSSYPPLSRRNSRGSFGLSSSSSSSTPSSFTAPGMKTPKQQILLAGYQDLPHYCFPDSVQATYQREKDKTHRFVLTQDGKRSYALAITFQQPFTLKTNKSDEEGVYHINDYKLPAQNSRRSSSSKIPVPIEKQKSTASSAASPTPGPTEKRSRKMPSAYPKVDTSSSNRSRSTSSRETDKQSKQPLHHYAVPTISSCQKNLLPSAPPPPLRGARTRSQDNVSLAGTTPSSSSNGIRKRTDSITSKPLSAKTTVSSSSSSSKSSASISTSTADSTSTPSETAKPFYLPHCIVLVASQPYWTAMQETISIIYDEITRSNIEPYSKEYKKLIQKYAFLACNTPIPPAPWDRYALSFNVANDRFVITFDPPINPNRSVLDLDLSILLLTLNIGKLLDILAAIFTEQPIIFFSSNYSTLVTTLECLLYLIYPLKWNNLYIPLVPYSLRDVYLEDAPGLFIKGAHPRHQSVIEQLNIAVTCNLDNDRNIFIPSYIDFHPIPPTKIHNFSDPITQLLEEIQKARAMRNVPTAARLPMEEQREIDRLRRSETNEKIANIFLDLMIDLCGDAFEPIYWRVSPAASSATTTPTKSANSDRRGSVTSLTAAAAAMPIFIKEKYLRPKIEGIDLEFYSAFVETAAFQNLIKEEMMFASPTGFRQICHIRALEKQNQIFRISTPPEHDSQHEPTTRSDSLSSQMLLSLPEWPSDLSTHYLDSCINIFTDELENAQQERSPAALSVYAYLRGCAKLARGDYLGGLRDLYLIENPQLFPRRYIETVIVPRLVEECLLDALLIESFYTRSPEWKKLRLRGVSRSLSSIDIGDSGELIHPSLSPSTPDIDVSEWHLVDPVMTYQQFSEHIHRLNIILDQETTEALFKALSYWTDNPASKTLKKENTLTDNPVKSPPKASNFTFQDTLKMLPSHARKNQASTPTAKLPPQPEQTLPTELFELFLDIWQQTNAEKVRMSRHLPEERHNQESILAVSSLGIVSKKDGPGQIILTQKRLYFLPETRSTVRLLTELINIESFDKYQHQTIFSSSRPGIKIHTSSASSLPRDQKINFKSKSASLEKDSKEPSSISLFFRSNQEQDLWYTIIFELWSGLKIADEQLDRAILNKASRHSALMDTLAHIDYAEQMPSTSEKRSTNPRQKSKQRHNETSLEIALKELAIFTRLRATLKPLTPETRSVLTHRLSPSVNEIERHAVRCLLYTEHPETGHGSLWCAYGSKLKVFNSTTWICDPNDLDFTFLITAMCLDARERLWVRCIGGELFVVDTLTRRCVAELETRDGENGSQTIAFDVIHNQILTANRNGTITLWNASNLERLYDINVLDIYRKARDVPEKTYVSQAVMSIQPSKESGKSGKSSNRKPPFIGNFRLSTKTIDLPELPPSNPPAELIPSPNDKLERIQIYENLLFACYHDDYIIVLRISDSNTFTYEHLISVEYKTGNSVPIDSFLVYNKQLWISTGCIISVFNVNNFHEENSYNLLIKTAPVDNDNLVTMIGVSGHIWAGSLNGNVYVFRMDKYELYKTFSGHRDSVFCLCPMLDQYVVSGSAQGDTSIVMWENVQPSNVTSASSTPTTKGAVFNLQGSPSASATPKRSNKTGDFIKSIDML